MLRSTTTTSEDDEDNDDQQHFLSPSLDVEHPTNQDVVVHLQMK